MQGGSWVIREHELEAIKQEHLLRHFQQIVTIAGKHYHYAFQTIKHLHRLFPDPHRKIIALARTLQQVVQRKKRFALGLLSRRVEEGQYERSKAGLLIAIFLERKIVGLTATSFLRVKKQAEARPTVPKDQQLFLIIKLSNLSKLLAFTKAEAFHCIRNEYWARTQEIRKAKLIKMGLILNNYLTRLTIDGFLSIANPRAVQVEDEMEDGEEIFIESYKSMAVNLTRHQNTSRPLRETKRVGAVQDLMAVLSGWQEWTMRGCLYDILCFQNQRFKPSTLAVLRRQIVAILEQQYESV